LATPLLLQVNIALLQQALHTHDHVLDLQEQATHLNASLHCTHDAMHNQTDMITNIDSLAQHRYELVNNSLKTINSAVGVQTELITNLGDFMHEQHSQLSQKFTKFHKSMVNLTEYVGNSTCNVIEQEIRNVCNLMETHLGNIKMYIKANTPQARNLIIEHMYYIIQWYPRLQIDADHTHLCQDENHQCNHRDVVNEIS
jgi:hypothetical protein